MTNTLRKGLIRDDNVAYTENGAVSNKSTLNDVLDFFYHAAARRGQDNTDLFAKAYYDNSLLAVKAAFYTRDVRGGQGERNTFRQVLRYLYTNDREAFNKIVALVPVYGRWDDVLEFTSSTVVVAMVSDQLNKDILSENPSLLGKWMPSANTSSKNTVALAQKWIKALGLTERKYRKMLSMLRAKINIVERLMSAKAFDQINYEHVPSRAAMLLRKAFIKHDGERYGAYIQAVKDGTKVIKANTLYPYELVEKYMNGADLDETIEAQWKALPNYVEGDESNSIVVVDVSGSMSGQPMVVAISLGLYIAERNKGAFNNLFITFSENPQIVQVRGNTLRDKVRNMERANWGANTNLQRVMDLILSTAVQNRVPQHEMPKKLFIVSDMQFDSAMGRYSNFDAIKRKFKAAGYEMPTIVFWNVDSRRDEAPVVEDDRGAFLVSGYSPSIFKATINTRATTPAEMMLDVLNSERYDAVEEALR